MVGAPATIGVAEVEEAIRKALDRIRCVRVVVGVPFEPGCHDDGAVDTVGIHILEQALDAAPYGGSATGGSKGQRGQACT